MLVLRLEIHDYVFWYLDLILVKADTSLFFVNFNYGLNWEVVLKFYEVFFKVCLAWLILMRSVRRSCTLIPGSNLDSTVIRK